MERPPLKRVFGDTEIRWTYALSMELQRIVPDIENVVMIIMTDPNVRDLLVRRALTDIKAVVKSEDELIPISEIKLDPDEVQDLLVWISEHLLYFFVQQASRMARLGEVIKTEIPPLLPLMNGSENSVS